MTFAHHVSYSCGLTHRKRKQNAMIASFIRSIGGAAATAAAITAYSRISETFDF